MVTMTVVTIVIIARGSSSMVAVMIARRKPIVAAIVSHALVTLWSTVVLASGDMPARTAVGVAACLSTASSRSITATGIVATAAFCNECQLMGVESLSAGQVGDSSQSYFIGCRNQRISLRETRLLDAAAEFLKRSPQAPGLPRLGNDAGLCRGRHQKGSTTRRFG